MALDSYCQHHGIQAMFTTIVRGASTDPGGLAAPEAESAFRSIFLAPGQQPTPGPALPALLPVHFRPAVISRDTPQPTEALPTSFRTVSLGEEETRAVEIAGEQFETFLYDITGYLIHVGPNRHSTIHNRAQLSHRCRSDLRQQPGLYQIYYAEDLLEAIAFLGEHHNSLPFQGCNQCHAVAFVELALLCVKDHKRGSLPRANAAWCISGAQRVESN